MLSVFQWIISTNIRFASNEKKPLGKVTCEQNLTCTVLTALCVAHCMCSSPSEWPCPLHAPCGYGPAPLLPQAARAPTPQLQVSCLVTVAAWQHSTRSRSQDRLGAVTGWPAPNRPAFALGGVTAFTKVRPRPFPSPPRMQSPQRPAGRGPRASGIPGRSPAQLPVEGWRHIC